MKIFYFNEIQIIPFMNFGVPTNSFCLGYDKKDFCASIVYELRMFFYNIWYLILVINLTWFRSNPLQYTVVDYLD